MGAPKGSPGARGVSPQWVLTMDTETFVVLAAGRRGWDDVDVKVEGDDDLARRVGIAMRVTP